MKGVKRELKIVDVPPGMVVGVVDRVLFVNHQTVAPPVSPIEGRIDINMATAAKNVSRDTPVSENERLPDAVCSSG